jgi:hypothetical protein
MNAKEAVTELMELDPTLGATLTGGVYGVAQISPTMGGPNPFDAVGRVKPCALVRNEVSTAAGPRRRFDRHFLTIFFYDHTGYDTIDDALDRTRVLLHEQRIGNGAYQVWHVDDVRDQYDDAILAFMHRSRYEVARKRT